MELRDYQITAKQEIYAAWTAGAQNVCVQLCTGAGKTVLFSNIAAEFSGGVIAIAHRMELVSQISLTLARYGIRHNIIAQPATIRNIVAIHMQELKKSFYDPRASKVVAGVDTLLRLPINTAWFNKIGLVIQDEAHHVLKDNKWGKAAQLFPHARGLYPTATPTRADGNGLGRHADGLMDALIIGPSLRELIERGYLTEYHVAVAPNRINLKNVEVGATGDFVLPQLRDAVHKAKITGDIVAHYLKFAKGKLGVTFCVDVKAATEVAQAYREAGVPAEVISGKTPDLLRHSIMHKFRKREILQLVNVDLLGEGVDVPAIEVVSMARPTQSYALFLQQFGRALRPLEGKKYALIIDHVSNLSCHDLPDKSRSWSLERRERKSRSAENFISVRSCTNPSCLLAFERIYKSCPFCGHYSAPSERTAPQFVDGDLIELDAETLAKMRGEIKRVDGPPRVPGHLDNIAQRAVINRHHERQEAQAELRGNIALWAGIYKAKNFDDSMIYRKFYLTFGIDIATAQTLGTPDAKALNERVKGVI